MSKKIARKTVKKTAKKSTVKTTRTYAERQALLKRRIQERNRRFQKMSDAEKRVAVAKDVLEQLAAGKYLASAGTYFSTKSLDKAEEMYGDDRARKPTMDRDVRTMLQTEKCEVCARGACFASVVRFQNGVKLGDIVNGDVDTSTPDYFTDNQLEIIESAFEIWNRGDRPGNYNWSDLWRWKQLSSADRMSAIMENIVANEGTFVAKQVVDAYLYNFVMCRGRDE